MLEHDETDSDAVLAQQEAQTTVGITNKISP